MARLNGGGPITLKPTQSQRASWAHAAMSRGEDTRSFLMWALDYMARYVSEVYLQNFHRQKDPILLRLEEKKRLRVLVDAAWHALDFLPPPSLCPVRGSTRDPKGDLRRALDDLHDYLDEVQEEYPKG
jgi:hypothetical protein